VDARSNAATGPTRVTDGPLGPSVTARPGWVSRRTRATLDGGWTDRQAQGGIRVTIEATAQDSDEGFRCGVAHVTGRRTVVGCSRTTCALVCRSMARWCAGQWCAGAPVNGALVRRSIGGHQVSSGATVMSMGVEGSGPPTRSGSARRSPGGSRRSAVVDTSSTVHQAWP